MGPDIANKCWPHAQPTAGLLCSQKLIEDTLVAVQGCKKEAPDFTPREAQKIADTSFRTQRMRTIDRTKL
jgi:hypothetical protein